MWVGKSDLRCERTSVCSRRAAPSEEGDRGVAHMDEVGRAAKTFPRVITPWQGKLDLISYNSISDLNWDSCLDLVQIPEPHFLLSGVGRQQGDPQVRQAVPSKLRLGVWQHLAEGGEVYVCFCLDSPLTIKAEKVLGCLCLSNPKGYV